MKKLQLTVSGLDELPNVARQILEFAGDRKIFAFKGEMGTGKTTLIKEICRQLGSHDSFSSPSFSIVNEYRMDDSRDGVRIYHLDLYRLKSMEEALGAGVEEYLNGRDYCFIEWYQLIEPLLPEETVEIDIRTEDSRREILIFSS